jgi:serine protease AprX
MPPVIDSMEGGAMAFPRRIPGAYRLAAALALVCGLTAAGPAAAAAPPAARSPWAAGQWASGTGNLVTDVAQTIGATGPAAAGLTGKGVGIALIDTGVVPVPGLPAAQVVNGPDLSFESQAPALRYLDTYGHGTHLAGIMVGNDPAAGLKGIAPGAKLTSIKVGTASGAADVSQVIAALDWTVQHRDDDPKNPIRVVCLAYGTDANANASNDPLLFAVENANKAGILVVVAGGNNGTALGRLNSPSLDQFVMTVGSAATNGTATQADDKLSTFTSIDKRAMLDVVAPGESIVSLRNPGSYIDATYPAARVGDSLFRGSGSSQATAVVSAAAALVLEKAPKTSPQVLKEWLLTTATRLPGTAATYTGGEINIANALKAKAPRDPAKSGGSTGLGTLQAARGSITVVDGTAPLKGEASVYGNYKASDWVTATKKGTAWKGGLWMGYRVAGDGWTGTSWASKTWGEATWTGKNWNQQAWADSTWSGRYWSGRYWSAGTWSGRYWSSSTWEGKSWSTAAWR